MFNLIEKFSKKLADKIDGTQMEKDKCEYVIHSRLSFIFTMLPAVIIAVALGYWQFFILIVALILWLRKASGGSHAQSPLACWMFSNIFYAFVGICTIYLYEFAYIFVAIGAVAIVTGLDEVPKYATNAPHHRQAKQSEFRNRYIKRVSILLLGELCLILIIIFNIAAYPIFYMLLVLISCCMLVNRFSLTNFSFWLFEKIN